MPVRRPSSAPPSSASSTTAARSGPEKSARGGDTQDGTGAGRSHTQSAHGQAVAPPERHHDARSHPQTLPDAVEPRHPSCHVAAADIRRTTDDPQRCPRGDSSRAAAFVTLSNQPRTSASSAIPKAAATPTTTEVISSIRPTAANQPKNAEPSLTPPKALCSRRYNDSASRAASGRRHWCRCSSVRLLLLRLDCRGLHPGPCCPRWADGRRRWSVVAPCPRPASPRGCRRWWRGGRHRLGGRS